MRSLKRQSMYGKKLKRGWSVTPPLKSMTLKQRLVTFLTAMFGGDRG
jgi:hypothetical protein